MKSKVYFVSLFSVFDLAFPPQLTDIDFAQVLQYLWQSSKSIKMCELS